MSKFQKGLFLAAAGLQRMHEAAVMPESTAASQTEARPVLEGSILEWTWISLSCAEMEPPLRWDMGISFNSVLHYF